MSFWDGVFVCVCVFKMNEKFVIVVKGWLSLWVKLDVIFFNMLCWLINVNFL